MKDFETNGEIIENSDLISEQVQIGEQLLSKNPYLIRNFRDNDIYIPNYKEKRTDEQRLKEYGIDSLDKLLEECILISQKQSNLPRSIRELVVKYSIEAFKELNVKAEEIKKESLENNTKEDDRKE